MKKILLFLILLPCLTYSQFIGFKGGPSISRDYYHGSGFLVTPALGIVYSRFWDESRFTFEPSLNTKGIYNRPRTVIINGIPVSDVSEKLTYHFVEFPITYAWLPLDKKVFFGLLGGLVPAYLTKAVYITSSSVSPKKYNFIKIDRKYNIDLIAGFETGVRVTENCFVAFNLRYGTTLVDIRGGYYFYISPSFEFGYRLKSSYTKSKK